ncbi:hypothetical protein PPL_02456 [Heterostelium album PN500]|uniref:Peptidase A1 domain-containing protein n=1 Tax=Heterostelium pallidum (strain ATCC 26659 / Pp 5 / PN500) TaxID=670386 RepID=D3B249_HETP5|nr:hypothetical protein PPL_02456 [Heterostelium album PN500]EFA84424.1 hypothetical protein PPL_02456 [Heterostelium album PN500]|eukprot:XP_020436538.1 hypothetical protein PPL_02456 [Heterostelium album PN500]
MGFSKLNMYIRVLALILFSIQLVYSKSYTMPIFPYNKYADTIRSKMVREVDANEVSMFSMRMIGDPIEIRTYVWVADQRQEVVVDSGSITLIVPSVACNTCSQPKPYYRPSPDVEFISCNSSECSLRSDFCAKTKVHPNGICATQIHYLDNTVINSFLVRDNFKMAEDMDNIPIVFGSIFSQIGGNPLKFGIMGMGNTCAKCVKSPIDAVFEEVKNMQRTFALWLDDQYSGVMTIGDLDPQFITGSLKYSPLMAIDTIHYGLLPSYATITNPNGESLVLTSKEIGVTLLDTGSSYTLLAADAYDSFRKHLSQNCTLPGLCGEKTLFDGFCISIPDSVVEKFPTIELGLLGDVTLEIPPQSYIVTVYENGIKFHCLGVKKSPLAKRSIVGLSWLRNTYVVFDKEHNRLGIGKRAPKDIGTHTPPNQGSENSTVTKKPSHSGVQHTRNPHNEPSIEIEKMIKIPCKFDVNHVFKEIDRTTGLSDFEVSITNNGFTDIQDLKILMTNNLVEIMNKQYDFQTYSFNPPLNLSSKAQTTFRYRSIDRKVVNILFPDIPECNKYALQQDNQVQHQEDQSLMDQPLQEDKNPFVMEPAILQADSTEYLLIPDSRSIEGELEEMEEIAAQNRPSSPLDQQKQQQEIKGIDSDVLGQPKPITKVKKIDSVLSNRKLSSTFIECPFEYNQRKGYEWRGSNGLTYSFYEVQLINRSPYNITDIILSTLDDVMLAIGMDKNMDENVNTVVSLPKSRVLAAGSDYRWLYCTRQDDSVTFSVVSTGNCISNNATLTTTPNSTSSQPTATQTSI